MNHKKNQTKRIKKPWPTKEVMVQIYEMKLWGEHHKSEFYSGAGSHQAEIINPYITVIKNFLSSFKSKISVCDLGCGDFNVGKEFIKYTNKFIAVDIVPDLIEHHKKHFKAENLEFRCLDISKDDLPKADCALVRQVFQHISNSEIQSVL
jgi:SAM-dependent methyltransferase